MKIIPIILCGGKGTRLWPLSRESFPKQFLDLYGDKKKSLLQQTQLRLSSIKNIDDPIIICNSEHRFLIAEQMRSINIKPKAIILEPVGRNTAPAITLGALNALKSNKDSILLVLSSDHKIENNEKYKNVIEKGYEYAKEGRLITFGIVPTYPETDYGYIESEKPFNTEVIEGNKILNFIEKPDKDLAKKLCLNKSFTWNSGIFMFQTKVFLGEIKKYSPKIIKHCKESILKSKKDLDFTRIDEETFRNSPNVSVDIAVMENTKLGTVLPLDAGWSDIGSWESLWRNEKKDAKNNFLKGKVIDEDSKNCYIRSESRLLVSLGLENLIIVETPDATLISSKKKAKLIKPIVEKLQKSGHKEGLKHRKIFRPWGYYVSIAEGENWQVKRIEVSPGSKLSLQLHNHRAEHWIVVSGIANVEIEKRKFVLYENQSTFIPIKTAHRLSNEGENPLVIIEVQSGDYLGEDDIIRFQDKYGRE
tara:strand:- start:4250 stop:5677 length:1428 start_codon:yes stop_codon:yes gene_type:complete